MAMSRALLFSMVVLAAPAFAEARFFRTLEDVPLPPGLTEVDAGFAFEGEAGRIVTARAEGRAAAAAVRDFYVDTLPALGWSLSPGGEAIVFQRGRERLTLSISTRDAGTRLEARLVVRPASMSGD